MSWRPQHVLLSGAGEPARAGPEGGEGVLGFVASAGPSGLDVPLAALKRPLDEFPSRDRPPGRSPETFTFAQDHCLRCPPESLAHAAGVGGREAPQPLVPSPHPPPLPNHLPASGRTSLGFRWEQEVLAPRWHWDLWSRAVSGAVGTSVGVFMGWESAGGALVPEVPPAGAFGARTPGCGEGGHTLTLI